MNQCRGGNDFPRSPGNGEVQGGEMCQLSSPIPMQGLNYLCQVNVSWCLVAF